MTPCLNLCADAAVIIIPIVEVMVLTVVTPKVRSSSVVAIHQSTAGLIDLGTIAAKIVKTKRKDTKMRPHSKT